jgi:GT2 family glycosyltransferase
LIVDDGSTDDLREVIKKYEDKLKMKYIFQQNKGPGAARNLGMEKADGDWFVFIDSDCTVPSDYVKNLENHIKKDKCATFGGPDTYREDFPPFLKAVNYSMTSFIGTGGARGSKGKSVAKYYPRSFNMGIKREVFAKIGGMNEMRHGQDMDFSNRIYRAGFRVKFLPDVLVYHKRRTSPKRFFKQIFNWGVTRINLGRIDKNMLKPVHCLPFIVVLSFFLTVFLSIFIPIFKYILKIELILGLIIAAIAFFQSLLEYNGLGFGYGLINSLTTKKGEFIKGFTKNYYK